MIDLSTRLALPRNTCEWKLAGTETFRLSSSKKLGRGTNLQNPSKTICKIYIPDPDKIFVQTDQSGAEALIVAYLCKPGRFRDLFLHNIKPHVFVGLHVFADKWPAKLGRPITEYLQAAPRELTSISGWKDLDRLIKSSDKWKDSERYYYIAKMICHCVTDDHEVLTKQGWVKVSEFNGIDEIAIACGKKISFEKPKAWNIAEYTGDVYNISGPQLDQVVTPNHTILYRTNNKFKTTTAENFANLSKQCKIPIAGNYIGGSVRLSKSQVGLIAAIQADGYILSNSTVRFRFKKSRKIERLKNILFDLQIAYDKSMTSDDVTEFYIKDLEQYIEWFQVKDKKWGAWLLSWSSESLDYLIDELKHWDGTFTESYLHKREAYFSMKFENVDWIKTILHLRNKQGTLNKQVNKCYTLGINNRTLSTTYKSKQNYTGKVYCPTTSTGFFLVRRNGKISITGNSSNYNIKAPTFALNVLQKSEGKIRLTVRDADKYLSLYHGLFSEIKDWHREIETTLQRNRKILRNLFGFPRQFVGPMGDSLLKEAFAFIPQSTVGTITNMAIVNMQKYIEANKLNWDILNNKHDSMLIQCPNDPDNIKHTAIKSQEFINIEMTNFRGEKFRMRSETSVGANWGELEEIKLN